MMYKLLAVFLVVFAGSGYAAGEDDAAADAIRKQLAAKLPNLQADSIVATPVAGLYEVTVESNIIYMSADGRYVLMGDLTDLETSKNLTEDRRSGARLKVLKGLDESEMVVFSPKDPKYTVTVFTDIDCGYCRKLHSEIAQYNSMGIAIRYLFYPRSGLTGESYKKAVSVWCADDQKAAMTAAKQGTALPEKTCENPVAKQYKTGEKFGIRGTPALLLENGQMLPGYLPPPKLLSVLNEEMGAK